jgi:hypothetical protein
MAVEFLKENEISVLGSGIVVKALPERLHSWSHVRSISVLITLATLTTLITY